jgi:hypothetical protein
MKIWERGRYVLSFVHTVSQRHMTVKHFLVNSSAVEIGHSPYSYVTSFIFLSLKGKTALKRQRFQDVMDIKKKVTTKLNEFLWTSLMTVLFNSLKDVKGPFQSREITLKETKKIFF